MENNIVKEQIIRSRQEARDNWGNMSPIFLPEFKTSPRLIAGTEKKKEEK